MRIYFRRSVTVVGCVLAALMICASYWQYRRYIDKLAYIDRMRERLEAPVIELSEVISDPQVDWDLLPYRRVKVSGTFDFSHEVALRNRRYGAESGVYALTPLRIDGMTPPAYVLVSRGFVPLSQSSRDARKAFHSPASTQMTGLVKEPAKRRFLAPKDPPSGPDLPWVDQWLRVDLEAMAKQLPYPLLPVWLETMETPDTEGAEEKIVTSTAGREEIFYLPGQKSALASLADEPERAYPVPVFDSVIPPGRHFGYIFEWAIMAFFTLLATFLLQLRPPRERSA